MLLLYAYECYFACMYVHHVYAGCLQNSEESVRSFVTGVIDSCEPPCGCRVLKLNPLREASALNLGTFSRGPIFCGVLSCRKHQPAYILPIY